MLSTAVLTTGSAEVLTCGREVLPVVLEGLPVVGWLGAGLGKGAAGQFVEQTQHLRVKDAAQDVQRLRGQGCKEKNVNSSLQCH